MARNPEDGAEADPEGRTTLSTTPAGPEGVPDQPAPALEQGEPSWPEDPEALRVEALSEEGAGLAPPPSLPGDEAGAPERLGDPSAPVLTEDPADPARVSSSSDSTGSTEAFPLDGAGPTEDRTIETTGPGEAPRVGFDREERTFEPHAQGAPISEPYTGGAPPGPVAPPPRRRGGAGALLLGSATAAALGFGAAWFARDRWEPEPAGLPSEIEERLAAIEARPLPDDTEVRSLVERLSEAEARLEALEEAPAPAAETSAPSPVDLGPLREEVAAGLAQAEDRAAALEERLAALEARPVPAEEPREAPAAGPALRALDEPDAGAEAVAALEPRLAAIESGTTEATAALSEVQADLEALGARVEESEAALSELDARSSEMPSATEAALSEVRTALEELRDRVGANDTALAEIDARLDEVQARLSDAEAASASAAEEARAAAALLAESRSRAEAAEAQARREAALVALDAALDAGEPLGALPDLGTEPPEALVRAAEEGIPSLASLRESFPKAARAGLAAARGEGLVEEGGVMGFLQGQLSMRSTAPREGDDPDAVLSRAEAALADGRLDATLAELRTLPDPVQTAMADWVAQARTRAEAKEALAALRSAEPSEAPAD